MKCLTCKKEISVFRKIIESNYCDLCTKAKEAVGWDIVRKRERLKEKEIDKRKKFFKKD